MAPLPKGRSNTDASRRRGQGRAPPHRPQPQPRAQPSLLRAHQHRVYPNLGETHLPRSPRSSRLDGTACLLRGAKTHPFSNSFLLPPISPLIGRKTAVTLILGIRRSCPSVSKPSLNRIGFLYDHIHTLTLSFHINAARAPAKSQTAVETALTTTGTGVLSRSRKTPAWSPCPAEDLTNKAQRSLLLNQKEKNAHSFLQTQL